MHVSMVHAFYASLSSFRLPQNVAAKLGFSLFLSNCLVVFGYRLALNVLGAKRTSGRNLDFQTLSPVVCPV